MINFKSIILRPIILLCACGFAANTYAQSDDAKPDKELAAVSSDEAEVIRAETDETQNDDAVEYDEVEVYEAPAKGEMYCRTVAPIGSLLKETRCITAEQRAIENRAARKFVLRAQGIYR